MDDLSGGGVDAENLVLLSPNFRFWCLVRFDLLDYGGVVYYCYAVVSNLCLAMDFDLVMNPALIEGLVSYSEGDEDLYDDAKDYSYSDRS